MPLAATLLLALALRVDPPVRAEPGDQFAPLAFLVGSCWVGTFPDGKQTDEHCFEWVHGRRFVRDRHVVRGGAAYEGETVYSWDAKAGRIVYYYWASSGNTSQGRVEPSGEEIVFPEKVATATGEVELRTMWTRVDADHYRSAVSQRTGDGWRPLWSMTFTRKR